MPIAAPLVSPLAPNLLEIRLVEPPLNFFRCANRKYKPDQNAVTPAESTTKEFRLRYELKSKTGGNSMGRGWKGLACKAVISVARMVGGRGDSGRMVSIANCIVWKISHTPPV
jgi:hypothetical protein